MPISALTGSAFSIAGASFRCDDALALARKRRSHLAAHGAAHPK